MHTTRKHGRFGWIVPGALCRWNDPGINDYEPQERKVVLGRIFEVIKASPFKVEENDDIILIREKGGASEAEVYAHELVRVETSDVAERMLFENVKRNK